MIPRRRPRFGLGLPRRIVCVLDRAGILAGPGRLIVPRVIVPRVIAPRLVAQVVAHRSLLVEPRQAIAGLPVRQLACLTAGPDTPAPPGAQPRPAAPPP